MLISDTLLCKEDSYTFYSSAHESVSWLDHIVATHSAHNLLESIDVDYTKMSSDHHPLVACINVDILPVTNNDTNDNNTRSKTVVKWDTLSVDDLNAYKNRTDKYLSCVRLDHDMILCDDVHCTNINHKNAIDKMYCEITSALLDACKPFSEVSKNNKPQVAGWNEYCKEAHSKAREAYLAWRDHGKPRNGFVATNMKRSCAYFKYLLRKCKSNEKRLVADSLANKLLGKSDKEFWKDIKKINQGNCESATSVNNVVGASNIADRWKGHFKDLLNSTTDVSNKLNVEYVINNSHLETNRFTIDEVIKAVKDVKTGKTCGLDNIYGEHLKFANDRLCALLAIVFNTMVIHNHLPLNMLDTIIVPLLKDKQGDVTDKDNYRPLALTCIVSKVFEFIMLHRYSDLLTTTANQFGFKAKMSTEFCMFSLKQVIEYKYHSSPVFACFLDVSKAFNRINYWHLFMKLLDRGLPVIIVRLFCTWYCTQQYYIQWANVISTPFHVTNGVPQGSLLVFLTCIWTN